MDLFYIHNKLKQPGNRPYAISRDVNDLESRKPVTKILRSDAFRGKLEDIFRNLINCGTPPAIRRLQSNITPASQIEKSIRQHNQPNLVKLSRSTNQTTVIPINDLHGVNSDKYSSGEKHARCKLASLYRVIERMGWTFEIYNHISLRYPDKDESFLINAFGLHYSEVTASNLIKTNLHGDIIDPGSTHLGLNRAGYVIHSAIHEARRDIKCIIHLNTPHGVAVSAMSCGLLPLCQEALIVGGLSYHAYRGIICDETEKAEIAKDLGPTNKAMVLHNRGLLAMGSTVEEAYYICTNLMVACKTQVLAFSAGLNNVILVDNQLAKKVYNTAIRAGGDVAHLHRLKVGELEYEAIMRVLDNQGYNTGYPYNTMELLCPPCTHQAEEKKTTATTSTAQSSDIDSITEKIKQQLDRIRREKQSNATITERDSSNLEGSISPSHIDLEYIAKHSSGTTQPDTQPVCYKSAPYDDPHVASAKSSEFSIDLNNSIQCDEKRNHPVATQIGVSFDNSQALVDNVYSESSTTANHVHLRVDQKTIQEISSAQAEKHIWDFLDERQSMGPLPISKKPPPSFKLHSESVVKSSDQSVHNPLVSSNHSDRVNSLTDNHRHITWDKQYQSTGIPNGMIDQPHHLNEQISSSQNPLQHSKSSSMQLQTNKTTTSRMKIASEDLPISNDGKNIEMLTGNHSLLSSTDRANFQNLTDWSHSQIRPSVESPLLTGTTTKLSSYSQLGSNSQSPQPYITLSPSQVATKTSDSSHSVEYDSNHAQSDSCSIDHNSNPSITDLRTGGAQMTLGVMQFPIQSDAKSEHSFQNPSSKPPINRDLEILLKVEETAKAVANSTGKSVHKLSHHSGHEQKQIRDREHMELQHTKEIPKNDSDIAKHNLTNFYTTIVPSTTTTDTTEPSAIYQPLPHTPLKQVTPTSQLIYMYSPPLRDDSLMGLEKAIYTAKKVAESTEKSIVKLRTSQNIDKSSQIDACNDNND